MNYNNVLNKIIKVIKQKCDPDNVILFGSRAVETSKRGSDIDIAILGSKKLSHREERRLREEIDKISGLYSVDIIFMEKVKGRFKELIKNTGITLYEKGRDCTGT